MPIAIDTETFLIERGRLAPKLVCMSMAIEGSFPALFKWDEARPEFGDFLEDPWLIVGMNAPFDMAVLGNQWPDLIPQIWRAYDEDRITDISVRQMLIDIAHGQLGGYTNGSGERREFRYHLADLSMRLLKKDRSVEKYGPDAWRLRYKELYDIPLTEWPEEAVDYARADAEDTLAIFLEQEKSADLLGDQFRQCRADFALHMMSCRGIRTERTAVEAHKRRTEKQINDCRQRLLDLGWLHEDGRRRKVKTVREYVLNRYPDCPKTPKFQPQLDEQAVNDLEDPDLKIYQTFASQQTIRKRIEELEQGVDLPIQARYLVLMESGRTSCRGPNLQNRSRAFGDRECFVPRPGYVFACADFDGFELRTIAQKCVWTVGHSRLGTVLNEGKDPHVILAAHRLATTYEKVITEIKAEKEKGVSGEDPTSYQYQRELAKRANFGFDGGLGPKGFVKLARNHFGIRVCGGDRAHNAYKEDGVCAACLGTAKQLREDWLDTWPEMREFFDWVRAITMSADVATIKQFKSERFRGHCSFTVASNTLSQGLGADAAKAATYRLQRACYVRQPERPDALLFGCFGVLMIHDELVLEVPDDELAADRAQAMADVMTLEANKWLPDVPTTTTPLLSRRWSKLARPTFKDGRLVPWDCEVK